MNSYGNNQLIPISSIPTKRQYSRTKNKIKALIFKTARAGIILVKNQEGFNCINKSDLKKLQPFLDIPPTPPKTYNGIPLSEIARNLGLKNSKSITRRIKNGWQIDDAHTISKDSVRYGVRSKSMYTRYLKDKK